MEDEEALRRIATCARLFDAWPNARPWNRDRTLIEYANATRGVPLGDLDRCIQLAIDAGGDFMPPAGEVLRRAAIQSIGGPPIGNDADARFWHDSKVTRLLRVWSEQAAGVAPLNPDAPGIAAPRDRPELPQNAGFVRGGA